jgi:hypothetical protein
VDNIDSRIGQISAVCVLAGEKGAGAYGIKTTADLLIPILRMTGAQAAPAETPSAQSGATPAGTATPST